MTSQKGGLSEPQEAVFGTVWIGMAGGAAGGQGSQLRGASSHGPVR